jgi:hypothetical protein
MCAFAETPSRVSGGKGLPVPMTALPSLQETLNARLIRNIRTSTRGCLSEALVRNDEWSHPMTKSKLLGLAAILSAAIATPPGDRVAAACVPRDADQKATQVPRSLLHRPIVGSPAKRPGPKPLSFLRLG